MKTTDYNLPIFENDDMADLNEYSTEMANSIRTQIQHMDSQVSEAEQTVNTAVANMTNQVNQMDAKVDAAIAEFAEPLSYKGEVTNISDLPSGANNGDIYSVTSGNKNYIWNGTAWVEYSSTIDLSSLENATKTTKQTQTGESQEITDCAGVKGKLDIKSGKSEQATRDGKNLINVSSVSNLTLDTTTKEVTIPSGFSGSGFIYWNNTPTLIANKTYLIEFYLSSTTTNTSTSTINLRDANGSLIGGNIIINNTSSYYSISYTPSSNVDITRIQIYFGTSTPSTGEIVLKAQIRESTTTEGYEPYGVSPSPDYPSDIRNVGDNNVFDGLFLQGYRSGNTNWGEPTSDTQNIVSKNKIFVNYGNNYKFVNAQNKTLFQVNLYKNDGTIIGYFNNTKLTNNIITLDGSVSLSGGSGNISDVSFISIQIKDTNGITPSDVTNAKLLSNSINFKVSNKNKFDEEWLALGTRYANNTISKFSTTSAANNTGCKNPIKLDKTKSYLILSTNSNYTLNGIYFYDQDGMYINRTFPTINNVSAIPDNAYYMTFNISGVTDLNDLSNYEWQVEYVDKPNSTATEYTPHAEQSIQFPLAEGQLLHEGDYLADDGIHQVRKTVVLDGTETGWALSSTEEEPYLTISDAKTTSGDIPANALSSHFKIMKREGLLDGFFAISLKKAFIFYDNNYKNNLNGWKTNLANNHITVEYELAEEIIIPYTEEQQEAYYQLQHLLMYKEYTEIECIDEIKPDIQATYSYNNEINNYYGNVIDALEERLHALEQS